METPFCFVVLLCVFSYLFTQNAAFNVLIIGLHNGFSMKCALDMENGYAIFPMHHTKVRNASDSKLVSYTSEALQPVSRNAHFNRVLREETRQLNNEQCKCNFRVQFRLKLSRLLFHSIIFLCVWFIFSCTLFMAIMQLKIETKVIK
jgi:hypothetical protein